MTNDETHAPEAPDVHPGLFVEGIDYYTEAGRWVFTAAYHLRRGNCCGSGCRHCPYGQKAASDGASSKGEPNDHRA